MPTSKILIGVVLAGAVVAGVVAFRSSDDATTEEFAWGLRIVVFSVGQADAIALVAPNGEAVVIDSGKGSTAAGQVAAFLKSGEANGVGEIRTVKVGFATHYDSDHVGGFASFGNKGIAFQAVYDQGPSLKRRGASVYQGYVAWVGDEDDDGAQDSDEPSCVRHKATPGLEFTVGDAHVRVLGVCGDVLGTEHDVANLDPRDADIDENPGSIALLISLGDFEMYSAGDQTSDDWKSEPDTEIAVVECGCLGSETDVDVLKVNHHGSDTSTGRAFVRALDPEIAIVSSKFVGGQGLPKRVSIQQLVENGAIVFCTGNASGPSGTVTESSATNVDDAFTPPDGAFVNEAGDVQILVSQDGKKYRVLGKGVWRELSAVDADHAHAP